MDENTLNNKGKEQELNLEKDVTEQNVQNTETEENEIVQIPNFEYDKKNDSQSNLVKLIVKDLKIRKKIEHMNNQKQKYENDEN